MILAICDVHPGFESVTLFIEKIGNGIYDVVMPPRVIFSREFDHGEVSFRSFSLTTVAYFLTDGKELLLTPRVMRGRENSVVKY